MYVLVNTRVLDQNGAPLPGVPVVILTTTLDHQGEGVTDGEGKANFLIYGPARYEARVYVPGYRTKPYFFELVEGEDSVFLDFTVERKYPQDALHPDMCTVYENFAAFDGQPFKGTVFSRLADAVVVKGETTYLNTASYGEILKGQYSKEFVRGSRVLFMLPGMEPAVEITIPNAPRARLLDLIAPYVKRVVWEESLPSTLSVGEEVFVPYKLEMSDGRMIQDTGKLLWQRGTEGIVALEWEGSRLRILGSSTGSVLIRGTEYLYPRTLPDEPFLNRKEEIADASFTVTVELPMEDIRCVQALMRMVLYRAIYDWKLYRSSSKKAYRKEAGQAYRWLFMEEDAVVTLDFVCGSLGVDLEETRFWARSVGLEEIASLYRGGRLKDTNTAGYLGSGHDLGKTKARSHRQDTIPFDGEDEDGLRIISSGRFCSRGVGDACLRFSGRTRSPLRTAQILLHLAFPGHRFSSRCVLETSQTSRST